jgi:hypothetical protein
MMNIDEHMQGEQGRSRAQNAACRCSNGDATNLIRHWHPAKSSELHQFDLAVIAMRYEHRNTGAVDPEHETLKVTA